MAERPHSHSIPRVSNPATPSNPPLPAALQDLVQALRTAATSNEPLTRENAQARLGELVEKAKAEVPSLEKLDFTHIWLPIGQIMELQGGEHIPDAIACYRLALEIFPDGETAGTSAVWRARAVAWMNLGNVLQKADDVTAGIKAYETSLENLSRMTPMDTDAAIMAGALWLNRGAALQRQNQPEVREEVIRSFRSAIDTLSPVDQKIPHAAHLLGAARLNLAAALLAGEKADLDGAFALAQTVITAFAEPEQAEPAFADISLRARKMVCEIAGFRISNAGDNARLRMDNIAVGSDSAEDALKLAAHWDNKGVHGFRGVVGWFLQYALTLYTRYQPQFLSEFVTETLTGANTPPDWRTSPELRQYCQKALESATNGVNGLLADQRTSAHAAELKQLLESLRGASEALGVPA
jgi:tetratricopeptide (TPR) repeat protein